MILTTREAVEEAIYALFSEYQGFQEEGATSLAARNKSAARLLCEQFGFRYGDFFTEGEA